LRFLVFVLLFFSTMGSSAWAQASQLQQVEQSALQRNFVACNNGYSSCNRALLTDTQPRQLVAKPSYLSNEKQAVPPAGAMCAENNSCYGDISTITGRPKTTAVQGYYRKDGTYVRGHYRSR